MNSKTQWRNKQNNLRKADTKVNRLIRKEKIIPFMLYDILSCITPHPTYDTITATIKKYLPKGQKVYKDGVGNLIVKVGKNYTTMFSCHIDMVFRKGYLEDKPKKLDLFVAQENERARKNFVWGGIITDYKNNRYLYTPTTLGADDKAGIFVLINLIQAKVPGLYIFHVGEEVGGIGSLDIKNRKPQLVAGIERAIAFDRMDYLDIIDRQRGTICCSHKFVNAFADQLTDLIITPNKITKRFKAATGTFTDTANYISLISECTNLSVGYFCQHSSEECLNTLWLINTLTPALLKVDWESLPTERALSSSSAKSIGWPQNNVESIGKYAPYSSINYNTLSYKLPPWTLSKGLIKSCSDVGMRRLIKQYVAETKSEFTLQQDILDLLKKNSVLEQRLALPVVVTEPKIDTSDLESTQKRLYNTLFVLTNKNFQIYKDHSALYTVEVSDYAEILKWAWEDFSKYEDTSFSMAQLFSTIKEILADILVINTTLIEETNFSSDDISAIIIQSMKFFKDNWFYLGYERYTDVQDEFKSIRNKITTAS